MTRRRLDAELVRRRMARGRTEARELIEAGRVTVGGMAAVKPASLVTADAGIAIAVPPARYVSRGGLKLQAALDAFSIPVSGRRGLDVGSSTGGFTDCLLQYGAAEVTALDVGTNQLEYSLRMDERVVVREQTNIRGVDPDDLGAPFDLVTCDVSFIGIARIAEHLARLGAVGTNYLLLVKPQFEVGRDEVGRGGVVRDPELHVKALRTAVDALNAVGLGLHGVIASPVRGAKGGNVEFMIHARFGPDTVDVPDLATVVAMGATS
ncbi:MAG: TlyA family RNA methyltransferase [Acidimicrobiia bacterium]|nr:TlyA family RNA methyltransferase [Acidimicrobiia bacterium]